MTRSIIDISHHDGALDFTLLAASGVTGVIAKATQGLSFLDPHYSGYSIAAANAGLLTGAYHFGNSEDVAGQVHHFLSHLPSDEQGKVPENFLIALDWEESPRQMTRHQAREFVQAIHDRTGRWPVLYGGSLLKSLLPHDGDEILNKCPLWLAQYGAHAALPPGWDHYTLWQYTGDDVGPLMPHTYPGAHGPLDISQYDGSPEQLQAAWPFYTDTPAPPVPPCSNP